MSKLKNPTKKLTHTPEKVCKTPKREYCGKVPTLQLPVVREEMISSKREVKKNEEKEEFDYFVQELEKIKSFVKIQQAQKKDTQL